jgi:hypothetical protein
MSDTWKPITYSVNSFHHETGYDRGTIDRWLRDVARMPNGQFLVTDIIAGALRHSAKKDGAHPIRFAEDQSHFAVLHHRALAEYDWSDGTPRKI